MAHARAADPALRIPPRPVVRRRAVSEAPLGRRIADAVREASLVGIVALSASWGLAELALLLLGTGPD